MRFNCFWFLDCFSSGIYLSPLPIHTPQVALPVCESYCGRGEDGPVAFNAQRQSLGFLFWMVTCSFTLYLLISHGMKAGGSVYSFIHSFIKGKCSRRYRKAQEDSGRLREAPEGSPSTDCLWMLVKLTVVR